MCTKIGLGSLPLSPIDLGSSPLSPNSSDLSTPATPVSSDLSTLLTISTPATPVSSDLSTRTRRLQLSHSRLYPLSFTPQALSSPLTPKISPLTPKISPLGVSSRATSSFIKTPSPSSSSSTSSSSSSSFSSIPSLPARLPTRLYSFDHRKDHPQELSDIPEDIPEEDHSGTRTVIIPKELYSKEATLEEDYLEGTEEINPGKREIAPNSPKPTTTKDINIPEQTHSGTAGHSGAGAIDSGGVATPDSSKPTTTNIPKEAHSGTGTIDFGGVAIPDSLKPKPTTTKGIDIPEQTHSGTAGHSGAGAIDSDGEATPDSPKPKPTTAKYTDQTVTLKYSIGRERFEDTVKFVFKNNKLKYLVVIPPKADKDMVVFNLRYEHYHPIALKYFNFAKRHRLISSDRRVDLGCLNKGCYMRPHLDVGCNGPLVRRSTKPEEEKRST